MSHDRRASATCVATRVRAPGAGSPSWPRRASPADGLVGDTGRLMLVAADHPARGALRRRRRRAGHGRPLPSCCAGCASRWRGPGVDGVLGTADILEDLLLLGALDGKVVIGSMNRGGLAGTVFEIDDRFTGYDAAAIAGMGFHGGKMLLRIDPDDPATAAPWRPAPTRSTSWPSSGLMAMVEPFISHRVDGRVRNDLSTEAVIRSATVAAGLGCDQRLHLAEAARSSTDMDGCWRRPRCRCCCSAARSPADQDAQFAQWCEGAGAARACAAWSSAARCSTRPTATSRPRSTRRVELI